MSCRRSPACVQAESRCRCDRSQDHAPWLYYWSQDRAPWHYYWSQDLDPWHSRRRWARWAGRWTCWGPGPWLVFPGNEPMTTISSEPVLLMLIVSSQMITSCDLALVMLLFSSRFWPCWFRGGYISKPLVKSTKLPESQLV